MTALLLVHGDDGFAIDEQKIIASSGIERYFTQRNAARSGWIETCVILNVPPGYGEHGVDLATGFLFGRFGHDGEYA